MSTKRPKYFIKNALLEILSKKHMSLDVINEVLNSSDIFLNRSRLRTHLWVLKKQGLVDNPMPGIFQITYKGIFYNDSRRKS